MRNRILRQHARRTVIVTQGDGTAFRGLLWDSDDRVVVLRNAEAVEAGGDRTPVPVDGEIVIPWPVAHLQFV